MEDYTLNMQLLRRVARMASSVLALFFIVVALLTLATPPAAAQHGCDPGNLIPNCNFDTFYGDPPRQVPEGWTPFALSGDLTFMQDIDTVWGSPALRMWSNGGTFVAGIYTQIGGLTPGNAYKASIGWAAPNEPDSFGRRLGIDPTGGTDPNSPNVVWGPMHRGPGRITNYPPPAPNIDVSALAESPTITVFVYVDHNYSTGDNMIFLDAAGLYPDATVPPAPPSPTAVPPTAPPAVKPAVRLAPAKTAIPTFTAAPTATVTATVTPTPAPTSTPTITPTPTATYTPSATPTSTLPPRPKATPGAATAVAAADPPESASPVMLLGGIGALGCAGLLGIALIVSKRR
jgi:hypothetical protein